MLPSGCGYPTLGLVQALSLFKTPKYIIYLWQVKFSIQVKGVLSKYVQKSRGQHITRVINNCCFLLAVLVKKLTSCISVTGHQTTGRVTAGNSAQLNLG